MEWIQTDKDWWKLVKKENNSIILGWVRYSIKFDCDRSCLKTGNTTRCLVNPTPKYIGWKIRGPVQFWFNTFKECQRHMEKLINNVVFTKF